MKRLIALLFGVVLILTACPADVDEADESEEEPEDTEEVAEPADDDADMELRWGAGGEGSVNAEAALASGEVLRQHGIDLFTVTTGGTVDGLLTLAGGELELANADNRTMTGVWHGEGEYEQIRGFSQVMSGFSTFFFYITHPDSGIETVEDLEGATINGHTPGAILNFFNEDFAESLYEEGIVADGGIETSQISIGESIDALLDGRIDAQAGYSFAGELPTWLEQAIARDVEVNSIMIPVEIHDNLRERGYEVVDDPAVDDFRRLDPDIPEGEFYTSGIVTIMVARDDVPEGAIYQLVEAWDELAEDLAEAHPSNSVYLESGYMERFLLDELPVHPGAQRWYDEQ